MKLPMARTTRHALRAQYGGGGEDEEDPSAQGRRRSTRGSSKAADTCTSSSVEEAVRHFFVEWNVKVYEARALATEAGGGGVTLTAKLQEDGAATGMARHKAMVAADRQPRCWHRQRACRH